MKERAQGGVITSAIIILLVISAIFIVWNFVRGVLSSDSKEIGTTAEIFAVSLSTPKDFIIESGNCVSVPVTRGAGGGELTSIKVVFKDNSGNIEVYENSTDLPGELETITYRICLSNSFNPVSHEVYPIFRGHYGTGSGRSEIDVTGSVVIVDSCRELNESKHYFLIQNVSSGGSCFSITSNNAVLDCGNFGNYISYDQDLIPGGSYGIRVMENNTLIINCTIVGKDRFHSGARGVYISGDDTTLQNLNVSQSYNGVYIKSSNNTVKDIVMSNNFWGIALSDSSGNLIENVRMNNSLGIYSLSSNYNIFRDNVINNPSAAYLVGGITYVYTLQVTSSSFNLFENNNITGGYLTGIMFVSSSNNTLNNNYICSSVASYSSVSCLPILPLTVNISGLGNTLKSPSSCFTSTYSVCP